MRYITNLKKVLFISLLVILGASQAGRVSAGVNVWTSIGGPKAGAFTPWQSTR